MFIDIRSFFKRKKHMTSKFVLTEMHLALIGIDWLSERSYSEFLDINRALKNFFTEEPLLIPKSAKTPGNELLLGFNSPLITVSNREKQSKLIVNIDRLDFISRVSSENDLDIFKQNSESLLKRYSVVNRIGIIATYIMETSEPEKWFADTIYLGAITGTSENLIRYNIKSLYKEKFESNKIVQIQTAVKRSVSPETPAVSQIQIQNDINTPQNFILERGEALNFFRDKIKMAKLNAGEEILK